MGRAAKLDGWVLYTSYTSRPKSSGRLEVKTKKKKRAATTTAKIIKRQVMPDLLLKTSLFEITVNESMFNSNIF